MFENLEDKFFAPLHGNSSEFDCHDNILALPLIEFAFVLLLPRLPVFVFHDDPDDPDDRRHDDDETTSTTTTPRPTTDHDDHDETRITR